MSTDLARRIVSAEARGADATADRLELMFVMVNPKVELVDQVMRRVPRRVNDRVRDEASTSMVLHLERMLTRPDLSVDLSTFLHTSPTDTMLRLLHSAFPQIMSGAHNRADRDLSETFDHDFSHPTAPPADAEACELDIDTPDLDHVREMVKSLRGGDRAEVGAKLLHDTYSIPFISCPPDRLSRNQVLRLIGERPEMLRDSLLAHAYGEHHPEPLLTSLWTQFTSDQAHALAERDDRVSQTVVTAALSPRPRMTQPELEQMRSLLEQGSRNNKWPALSRKLLRTWAAEFTGRKVAVGDTDLQDPPHPKAWFDTASEVLQMSGRPLGPGVRTARDVDDRLQAMLELVRAQR